MKKGEKIFLLTSEQWLGVLILSLLLIGTMVAIKHLHADKEAIVLVEDSVKTNFENTLAKQDSIYKANKKNYKHDTIEIRMQMFDPNTVDSIRLLHLGFQPWQAKNMLKYRAKGGKYRNKEDLKKLYGMTDSMYLALEPYIQISQDGFQESERKQKDEIQIILQSFNPNTADSSTLVHLGFKPWQAKNMLKYRAKGGKYRKAEDLKRLYGMTDSMYMALEPYIHIPQEDTTGEQTEQDGSPKGYAQKKDTILNLRTADTTELKMIRGIGSYRAKMIVRYREQLGGYARVEQMMEAKGMEKAVADSILPHFYIDSVVVEKLALNRLRPEILSRHPYLSFEQAKAIYEYRRKRIRIKSADELKKIKALKEEDIEKLLIYLDFS
jgi:competence ComEA-like helix-hairpin-helix protein